MKKIFLAATLSVGLFSTTSAHAVLTLTLGGQGVYDDHLNITWLQNANLAATEKFGVTGISSNGNMSWDTAQSWIAGMNTAKYLGYNDWRLPTTFDIGNDGHSGNWYDGTGDYGYNVTSSEMGHLYYTELVGNLGAINTSGAFEPGYGLTNIGPFSNVQSDGYWSGTEYAPNTDSAWVFSTYFGYQDAYRKDYNMYAWAVRPGDSVSAVPEPETYAMLLAGLGLLGFTAKRRKQRA